MAISLLTRFLAHYDPLFYGATAGGIAAGPLLMSGVAGWCDPAGRHLLYRGDDDVAAIDYDTPVGAASPTATDPTKIDMFSGYSIDADSIYYFAVRAVGRGGAEEENTDQIVRVETDGLGDFLPRVPNAPRHLMVTPVAGGKLLLRWRYDSTGQQVAPTNYRIYHDNGSPSKTMIWAPALDVVEGTTYLTEAYAAGTRVQFGVRAYSNDGGQENNTDTVFGLADVNGPKDAEAPAIGEGEET